MSKSVGLLLCAIAFTVTACASDVVTNDPSESRAADEVVAAEGAPYPLVFLHGASGFAEIEVGPLHITYFRGVVRDLRDRGEEAFATTAPPWAPSDARAPIIAQQIDQILSRTRKRKVHLIGHSQGGIDARYLASPAGFAYGDRIASIATVSSPHRGSRVADTILGAIDHLVGSEAEELTRAYLALVDRPIDPIENAGLDVDLIGQLRMLSERYMKETFNPRFVDDPRVRYTSYAGRSNRRTGIFACGDSTYDNDPFKVTPLHPLLFVTGTFLEQGRFIVNDGLVTIDSARWGRFEQCIPADHLGEIGYHDLDQIAFYRTVVDRIRSEELR
jgi:pimeloyl-ACP methyl ester carboxylesterase